jgi:hypothetical protein
MIVFVPGGSVGSGVADPPGLGDAVGDGLGDGLGDGDGLGEAEGDGLGDADGAVLLSAKTTNAGVAGIVNGTVPAGNDSVLPLSEPVAIVTKPALLLVDEYSSSV